MGIGLCRILIIYIMLNTQSANQYVTSMFFYIISDTFERFLMFILLKSLGIGDVPGNHILVAGSPP